MSRCPPPARTFPSPSASSALARQSRSWRVREMLSADRPLSSSSELMRPAVPRGERRPPVRTRQGGVFVREVHAHRPRSGPSPRKRPQSRPPSLPARRAVAGDSVSSDGPNRGRFPLALCRGGRRRKCSRPRGRAGTARQHATHSNHFVDLDGHLAEGCPVHSAALRRGRGLAQLRRSFPHRLRAIQTHVHKLVHVHLRSRAVSTRSAAHGRPRAGSAPGRCRSRRARR